MEYALCSAQAYDPASSAELEDAGVAVYSVRDGLLRKLVAGAKPIDWLAVAALPDEVSANTSYGDFAVVCEQVSDPGNLGTIVRTACALGVRDVVLTDADTDLWSRKVLDAARGAVLGCRVRRFGDSGTAVKALREAGFQIVVTSPRGAHLQSIAPIHGRKVALVVGNETDGVSADTQSMADLVVQIPMAGAVESLNVGVATGISIYELRMRMILAMLTDRIRDTLGRNLGAAAALVQDAFDAHLRQAGDLTRSGAGVPSPARGSNSAASAPARVHPRTVRDSLSLSPSSVTPRGPLEPVGFSACRMIITVSGSAPAGTGAGVPRAGLAPPPQAVSPIVVAPAPNAANMVRRSSFACMRRR
ncbi:TrmH family RNA methyltransferase [Nocardia sp. NPDC046473]|uniref:TrmH family RNA methyltransferase n=1 Tax=Nocardia sp. NPDC046473 TaxID=3155733 RepID=UPI0033FAD814